jgi:hypothetical protein
MTPWTRSAFIAALAMIIAGPAPAQSERGSKGFEIYSWRENADWRFSLLYGTNRFKFCPEIKSPKGALTLAQLEEELSRIAPMEYVSWHGPDWPGMEKCGIAYPPQDIVARVRGLGHRLELKLTDGASPPDWRPARP